MADVPLLDFILVPLGVVLLALYHVYLFRRVISRPTSTVIGVNAINRRLWTRAMMSDQAKNGVLAVQTLRNSIMASTLLATISITLCSIIVLLLNSSKPPTSFVLGATSPAAQTAKYFSLLVAFLAAFLFNVESIRYYSHASVLINVPLSSGVRGHVTEDYVVRILNRGSYWFSAGLKAFYFSFPLFLWVFGPIPMFACSVVMLVVLFFLDRSSELTADDEEEKVAALASDQAQD